MATVDIATKVIQPSQQIWAVFPGNYRKFLDQFFTERAVFLDVPGIQLTPEVFANDDLLRKHIAMSDALADFHAGHANARPSRRVSGYPVIKNASFNAAVGNVRNMYLRMQRGDLVLVGQWGYYEPVLIGEITSNFNPANTTTYKAYGDDPIPVRRVRWLPGRHERRYLSEPLSRLLSNRKAIISIDKEVYGDEVYRLAYGDYVFDQEARYVFHGDTYKNIATATVPAIQLISYFAAAFQAADDNEIEKFAALSIENAIETYFEGDTLKSFEINFASPGNFVLHAKRAALPLLAAVLVFVTSGTMSYEQAIGAEIVNSATVQAAPADPHDSTPEVQEKYKAIMESLGKERFEQLQRKNQDAQAGVGLQVHVKEGH